MLSIDIRHPDSLEFITKKQDLTKVTGANVSVKVCDNFMKAVLAKEDYILRFPVELKDETVAKGIAASGIDVEILEYNVLKEIGDKQFIKKIKADELWNTLMKCAWGSAEPGIIFIDAMHNSPDGVYNEFKMVCTNPCGR